jgi:hypothetical protein
MLKLTKINQFQYYLCYENGIDFGTVETSDDGYFYLWMLPTRGFIPAYVLREAADLIDELNEPWDKIVEQGLQKSRQPLEDDDFVSKR